jgi:sodium pump decarboxylase gamma subunit
MSPLVTSLWITLIGMGLVFIAILLLWGLMEGLMRLAPHLGADESEEGEGEEEGEAEAAPEALPAGDRKKRAAAAAVAIAMALRRPSARKLSASSGGSAWQAVTRASQLNHPTHITRKSRGSVR